jgi:hypothetical protein
MVERKPGFWRLQESPHMDPIVPFSQKTMLWSEEGLEKCKKYVEMVSQMHPNIADSEANSLDKYYENSRGNSLKASTLSDNYSSTDVSSQTSMASKDISNTSEDFSQTQTIPRDVSHTSKDSFGKSDDISTKSSAESVISESSDETISLVLSKDAFSKSPDSSAESSVVGSNASTNTSVISRQSSLMSLESGASSGSPVLAATMRSTLSTRKSKQSPLNESPTNVSETDSYSGQQFHQKVNSLAEECDQSPGDKGSERLDSEFLKHDSSPVERTPESEESCEMTSNSCSSHSFPSTSSMSSMSSIDNWSPEKSDIGLINVDELAEVFSDSSSTAY